MGGHGRQVSPPVLEASRCGVTAAAEAYAGFEKALELN